MSYLIYMKDRKGRIYPSVWAELPRDGTGQSVSKVWNFIAVIELPDEDAKLSLTILENKYPCSVQETESRTQKTSSQASKSTTETQPIAEEL